MKTLAQVKIAASACKDCKDEREMWGAPGLMCLVHRAECDAINNAVIAKEAGKERQKNI